MVVKIEFVVFWVVMLCNVVVWYQCFGGPCCGTEGNMVLWNSVIQPSHYTA